MACKQEHGWKTWQQCVNWDLKSLKLSKGEPQTIMLGEMT